MQLGSPVYGEAEHQGYLEYMAPGVVVSICYIMATGLTALAFIIERRDGLFERSLVAGVDTLQILLAHALVQIFVMVIQIILVLFFTFLVFDIPSRGPFVWVILLLLLQGATGMAFGKTLRLLRGSIEAIFILRFGRLCTVPTRKHRSDDDTGNVLSEPNFEW